MEALSKRLVAALLFASLALVGVTRANSAAAKPADQSVTGLRRLIESVERDEFKQIQSGREPSLLRLMSGLVTPDFTYTKLDGRSLTFQQARAEQRAQNARFKLIDGFSFTIQSMLQRTSGVWVMRRQQMSGTFVDGKNALRRFSSTATMREQWVRQSAQWRLRSESVCAITATIDGKPYYQEASNR